MTCIDYTDAYRLPWPQVWIAMSWEMAHWVASCADHSGVKVTWNEDLLTLQVDSQGFHQATQAMREALEQVLGERLQWEVQRAGHDQPHRLQLIHTYMKKSIDR